MTLPPKASNNRGSAHMTRLLLTISVFVVYLSSAAARAESLKIVTSLDPLEAREYIAAFENETGVKVQWIRLSAGEALARLKSESKNPTQDVWFGTPATELAAAKSAGLLVPHSSAAVKEIPEKWRDPEGYWTGIYFGAIAFISGKGVNPPKTWADLLRPEYKGEIVVSYPYTAGTGYIVLAGLAAMMGEDGAMDFYEKLDRQVRRYTKSGGAPIIEVGLGEASVGIVFEQDALRKGVSRGFPITVTLPSDGIPYEIGGVGIIAGKISRESKTFVDWIASPPAQGMMKKWFRTPIHPKASCDKNVTKPDNPKLAPMNMQTAGEKRGEIIKLWRERIQK